MKKLLLSFFACINVAFAAPLGDYQFKSPAFNGAGYSSHVLTIYNLEQQAQKARADAIQAAIDKAAAAESNTNLAKFVNNLESRIYAQISQNVATAMFANGSCKASDMATCTGSINFQGNYIGWSKVSDANNCVGSADGTCIKMVVADPTVKDPANTSCTASGMSCIYIPLSQFQIPGN